MSPQSFWFNNAGVGFENFHFNNFPGGANPARPHFGNHGSKQSYPWFALKTHLILHESNAHSCSHFICYSCLSFLFSLFVVGFIFLRGKEHDGFSTLPTTSPQGFKQEINAHWRILWSPGERSALRSWRVRASLPKIHHKTVSPSPHDGLWWVIRTTDKSKVAAVRHLLLLL